ncbi:MAG: AAA family ATPase [Polyangiaceae bacterium]|nr:AAA family ATPase [Polyangiaceae bacterium]
MSIVTAEGHRLYVLIDEYDSFANDLLSAGKQDLYEPLTEHTGFVRSFYRTLKSGTQSGAIGRLFVTGVSPLLLDDMASGFNIATHISRDPRMSSLVGFTRADVERALDELLDGRPELAGDPRIGDRAALLAALEQYYDGYRFAEGSEERVFNSNMVLYFLRELENKGRYPTQMLDMNVRIDYGRLQQLAALTGASGGRLRPLMESILEGGHTLSGLTDQLGVRSLSSQEQYLSLLYYLGLLTIGRAEPGEAGIRLEIPNRVIRELQWKHLALLLQDELHFELDTEDLAATRSAAYFTR